MSHEIYQKAIKDLALANYAGERLKQPSATVSLDTSLCGDRITLDVQMDEGRISAIGHETRGCLLCRAAASLLGRMAPGSTPAELQAAQVELTALLDGQIDASTQRAAFSSFSPVAGHRSRHGCVLLPFRALSAALEALQLGCLNVYSIQIN